MRRYDELKELLATAGKYPALERIKHAAGHTFRCPMCNGEGEIDAECVSEGDEAIGGGIMTSIVGVQVFGIGEAMTAMEKLVPKAIEALPELIAASEDAARIIAQRDRLAEAVREVLANASEDCECGTVYRHCDMEDLEQALAELDKEKQS